MFKEKYILTNSPQYSYPADFFVVAAKNEIQPDSPAYQGAQPGAEFSEAMRKMRTGGDTPTFQRSWEPENTGKYAITPRKARLSCLCKSVKT